MSRRKQPKARLYLKVFLRCAMCGRTATQVHHIRPLSKGGSDTFDNYIALCKTCHGKGRLHSEWQDNLTELLTLKFFQELEVLGITSDEVSDDEFRKILHHHLAERRAKSITWDPSE